MLEPVNASPHIAIVDDESDITRLLANYLQPHGFRTTQLHAGRDLLDLMPRDTPQLVLLDLGLPGEDGFAIARQLREHWRCGLVIVTGRGDSVDKVVGLEIGADDYITKPFDLRELLARIKAVLRRMSDGPRVSMASERPASIASNGTDTVAASGREAFSFQGFTLDASARRLLDASAQEIPLTTGEFELLHAFVSHPGRVLSRDFLLETTRGREAGPFDRTIDVQVGRLRRKIETEAGQPALIKSVRGAGYLFTADVRRLTL